MILDFIILFLIIIGVIIGFVFFKIIKHYNYELNFKESLLFYISILILMISILVDFNLLNLNFNSILVAYFSFYFLVLLLFYYIVRSIKIKKYIPCKIIIIHALISALTIILSGVALSKTTHIDGWDALGFVFVLVAVFIVFIIILLLQNIIIYVIGLLNKSSINYKNEKYKLCKSSYVYMLSLMLLMGLFFGVDSFNNYNYNKQVKKQSNIVVDYLNQHYPDYKFVILKTYETKTDCSFFCETSVFRNEIETTSSHTVFNIDVRKNDLIIYNDEFEDIIENQMNQKKYAIKKYLEENYNIMLNYEIENEQIKNVKFKIYKNYQKEQIDLFIQDMKNIFIYVETNFYDLNYVELYFENGNPFYEGEYEYFKSNGSINENSMTNELWIMINEEYIFIEK